MKNLLLVLSLVLTMITITTAQQQTDHPESIIIPDGMEIPAIATETITSENAATGTIVNFAVAENVQIGLVTIIKEGTVIKAAIGHVQQAGRFGRPGELEVRFESTTTADNQRLKLRNNVQQLEGESNKHGVFWSGFIIGPFALLKKGDEAVIPRGTTIKVYVDEQKTISTNNVPTISTDEKKEITQAGNGKFDYYAALVKLKDLKDKGIITEDEFEAKKKEILKRY